MMTLKGLPRSARITALTVILVDETTKTFARALLPLCVTHACGMVRLGPISLSRQQNAGSAFGFAQGVWVWPVVAIVAVLAVPLLAQRSSHPAAMLGGALVLAGGVSNLMDRMVAGSVTDFLSVGGHVFVNLADIALAGGCALMSLALSSERSSAPSASSALSAQARSRHAPQGAESYGPGGELSRHAGVRPRIPIAPPRSI